MRPPGWVPAAGTVPAGWRVHPLPGRGIQWEDEWMVKRLVVEGLERLCTLTHPVLHRRPFLWFGRVCWLSLWSYELDQRWHTGRWGER